MPEADWPVSYPGITIMSRLESVENEVKQLTAEELRAFRDWFVEFDSAHGMGSSNGCPHWKTESPRSTGASRPRGAKVTDV
jgi:hypothetical protein